MDVAKLKREVDVLMKENAVKADEILQLEKDKMDQAKTIIDLQVLNANQGKDILDLKLDQKKTLRQIDELTKKVDKIGKKFEMMDGAVKSDKRRALADGNQHVAFTAFLSPYESEPLGQEQIVKFDNVVTNIGNAYHSHSGTFIAPVDGVYMFFATIAGNQHALDRNYVRFLHNGNRVTEIRVTNGNQSSQQLILTLDTNDEIHLINNVGNDRLFGEAYSSFSGVLLFPKICLNET